MHWEGWENGGEKNLEDPLFNILDESNFNRSILVRWKKKIKQ